MERQKRIVLEVTDEEHKMIKMTAVQEGVSIKKYVLDAIVHYALQKKRGLLQK